jgi:hypothetical protein
MVKFFMFRKYTHKSPLDTDSTSFDLQFVHCVSYRCNIHLFFITVKTATLRIQRIAWIWKTLYFDIIIYIYIHFQTTGSDPLQKIRLDIFSPVLQLNKLQQKLLYIYCKYNSVSDFYSFYNICTVNTLCGKTLNVTSTASLCEQQSATIYIHCPTVFVCSVKQATKMSLLVPPFFSVRPSSTRNILNTLSAPIIQTPCSHTPSSFSTSPTDIAANRVTRLPTPRITTRKCFVYCPLNLQSLQRCYTCRNNTNTKLDIKSYMILLYTDHHN